MVTKKQIKRLKDIIRSSIGQVDEAEIYLISEKGSIETPAGEIITKSEYDKRLKKEREGGEEIVEINIRGAE